MNASSNARYHVTGSGFLRLAGADRVDFIQRQSTNDLTRLTAGTHLSTVLTNPAARIIDVLQVFPLDDETLAAVTLPGRGAGTFAFLKKRIFFNDQVTIEDAGADYRVIDLLDDIGPIALPTGISQVETGAVKSGKFEGQAVIALGLSGTNVAGRRIVVPAAVCEAFMEELEKAGVTALTSEEFEVLRIEAGQPGPAGELTEDFTPLETGLAGLVSDTKGCYTGQEVIARQITYDKITRGLAGIRLEGPARTGARVLAGESSAGSVTSYINSPREGYLALAVLKRPYGEPGTEVRVETGNGEIAGRVVPLPFS